MKKFIQIFKDTNDWNEKTIIGFLSFAVMVLVMFADVVSGAMGKDLVINEFTYNSVLGFISLNQSLNNDQVLGVSYQYTYAGKTYQVGELSTDGVAGQNALFLKLLNHKSEYANILINF